MPTAYAFSERSTAEALARSVGPTGVSLPDSGPTANMFVVKLIYGLTAYNPAAGGAPWTDAQILTDTPNNGFVDTSEKGLKQKTVKVYNVFETEFDADTMHICGRLDGRLFIISPFYYKSLVRFTLDAALTTADASQTATITDQYGPGVDNTTASGGIIVHNMETSAAGTYMFEGNLNDAGLAMWDQGTDYRIIQIECDTTPAGGEEGGGGGETPGGETP